MSSHHTLHSTPKSSYSSHLIVPVSESVYMSVPTTRKKSPLRKISASTDHLLSDKVFGLWSQNGTRSDQSSLTNPLLVPTHKASAFSQKAMDINEPEEGHRGELGLVEKYKYDLSKAQLKASSRTSALLAGFAMVALVELQYDEYTPHSLLIILGVVTTLLVSVHLLALMMSTCILPYMEASGSTQDSPHIRLKFYIDLSWLFSTCIGLVLFLVEIGVIFFVKFSSVNYAIAGYITTAMLVPVLFIFVLISCLIHRSRADHSLERMDKKMSSIKQMIQNNDLNIKIV